MSHCFCDATEEPERKPLWHGIRSHWCVYFLPQKLLIPKIIGNREGDCAWSCSRWQTQPEKICKSQRTIANQCHSLRTLYWFVLCNLQIFSGCVCHLEQLHAPSTFLFPIVFGINLIPFFDIFSVLAVPSPRLFVYVLLYLGRCVVATVAVCGFGSWSLVFTLGCKCYVKSPLFPKPLSNRSVLHDGRKHKTVVFSHSNALREWARRTNFPLLAIGCCGDCSGERRTSPFNGMERSLSRAVVIKTKSLPSPLPRFQQRCLCTSRTMGESISTIQRSPRISTLYKFAAFRYRLPLMALQTVRVEPRLYTALKDCSVVP